MYLLKSLTAIAPYQEIVMALCDVGEQIAIAERGGNYAESLRLQNIAVIYREELDRHREIKGAGDMGQLYTKWITSGNLPG